MFPHYQIIDSALPLRSTQAEYCPANAPLFSFHLRGACCFNESRYQKRDPGPGASTVKHHLCHVQNQTKITNHAPFPALLLCCILRQWRRLLHVRLADLGFEGRQWRAEKSSKGCDGQSCSLFGDQAGHMRDFDSAFRVGPGVCLAWHEYCFSMRTALRLY